MSDQCEKHRRNGVDLVDPHQLVCPDCDNERLNKRIEELEAKINRGQYMVCEKHPFLTTASPTATALDCPYCKMARVEGAIPLIKRIAEQKTCDEMNAEEFWNGDVEDAYNIMIDNARTFLQALEQDDD